MLSKASACSLHHRKITKAAWATKAKDRILRTSSSLYSSLEGFQRKSYCPWNGRFRVVSDLRPASPAKSGVRWAALPRFVGPSRSHPPVAIARGRALGTHISIRSIPAAPDEAKPLSPLRSGRHFAPEWSRKCSGRDRWSPRERPGKPKPCQKICDFRGLLLGTKIHIKYGAATFFLYSAC